MRLMGILMLAALAVSAQQKGEDRKTLPLKPALQPHRAAADFIEGSDLDFTILRPALFTSDEKVDFEITQKGTPEKGSVVSQKSLAAPWVSTSAIAAKTL